MNSRWKSTCEFAQRHDAWLGEARAARAETRPTGGSRGRRAQKAPASGQPRAGAGRRGALTSSNAWRCVSFLAGESSCVRHQGCHGG